MGKAFLNFTLKPETTQKNIDLKYNWNPTKTIKITTSKI